MDVNLTVNDIQRISRLEPGKINVIHSGNRREIIDSIFQKSKINGNRKNIEYYLIHYETGSNGINKMGHWVGLIIDYNNKEILFFDSMGIFPDNELNLINEKIKKDTDQDERLVGKL